MSLTNKVLLSIFGFYVLITFLGVVSSVGTKVEVTTIQHSQIVLKENANIAFISDYNSKNSFMTNWKIFSAIKKNEVDLIVIGGDFKSGKGFENEVEFASQLVEFAPTVYARGNYDDIHGEYEEFTKALTAVGVNVLSNSSFKLNDNINVIGLEDNSEQVRFREGTMKHEEFDKLAEEITTTEEFDILVAHRPQYFYSYCKTGAELILSGHAYGGVIKVPFTDTGLISPDQGIFPQYTNGIHSCGISDMVISSGVSDATKLPRLFNKGEVNIIKLESIAEEVVED